MILTILNVIYVLIAVAMIALILLQRGQGAAAGSGFGAGASATVFGSRGASNFLSKSTAVLATLFFVMSLGMAMYAARGPSGVLDADLGVMGAVPAASETPVAPPAMGDTPEALSELPAAPATEAPVASDVPAASESSAAPDAEPENGERGN